MLVAHNTARATCSMLESSWCSESQSAIATNNAEISHEEETYPCDVHTRLVCGAGKQEWRESVVGVGTIAEVKQMRCNTTPVWLRPAL